MTEISLVSLNTVLGDLRGVLNFEKSSKEKEIIQTLERISENLFQIGRSENVDNEKGLMILTLKSYVVQIMDSIVKTKIFVPRYLIDSSTVLIKNLYCK